MKFWKIFHGENFVRVCTKNVETPCNFINDNPQNKQIRFIAQNLRNIFNDNNIVQGDEKDLQDHNVPLTVDYGRMTTYLYGALKQSITEIENLKKKNNELEEIIISIKDEIKYLKYSQPRYKHYLTL